MHEIFENLNGSIRKTQEKQSDFYERHTASYSIKVGNFMLPRISKLQNSRNSSYSCLKLYISAAVSPTECSQQIERCTRSNSQEDYFICD